MSVYTPPPSESDDVKSATLVRRIRRRAKEPACLKEWRQRMAGEAGKAVYALRKHIERINADRKNHGFGFLPVRGGQGPRALARARQQPPRRSPPEDQDHIKRPTKP